MTHYFLIMDLDKDYLTGISMRRQANGFSRGRLTDGVKIDPSEVEQPLIAKLKDPEDKMPEMFEVPLVMRPDLLQDIRDFGIDNIQTFKTLLRSEDGKTEIRDYIAVNVIGLVDVFDLQNSERHESSPYDTAYLFNSIVIKKDAAKNHHLFP